MSSTTTDRRDLHPMHNGPRLLLGSLERRGLGYEFVGRCFGAPAPGTATHASTMLTSDHEMIVALDRPNGCFIRTFTFDAGNALVGSYDGPEFSVLRALAYLRGERDLADLTDYRG
jgi:hypothetical protein